MNPRTRPFQPTAASVVELAAGAVLVDRSTRRVALLHVRAEDRWCLPKGHVETGESLVEAAGRELREETGIAGAVFAEEVAEVHYRFFDPARRLNVLKTIVFYLAYSPEVPFAPERMFDHAGWYPLAEAISMVPYDSDRAALQAARTAVDSTTDSS